jgi:hypothetical protein
MTFLHAGRLGKGISFKQFEQISEFRHGTCREVTATGPADPLAKVAEPLRAPANAPVMNHSSDGQFPHVYLWYELG